MSFLSKNSAEEELANKLIKDHDAFLNEFLLYGLCFKPHVLCEKQGFGIQAGSCFG